MFKSFILLCFAVLGLSLTLDHQPYYPSTPGGSAYPSSQQKRNTQQNQQTQQGQLKVDPSARSVSSNIENTCRNGGTHLINFRKLFNIKCEDWRKALPIHRKFQTCLQKQHNHLCPEFML